MLQREFWLGSFLFIALEIGAIVWHSPVAPSANEGIDFFTGSWDQALNKSRAESKPIFLDIYATWCKPCLQLKTTTFRAREVGEYFNSNFINISINGETEEGIKIINKYNLTAYPTLLIIDKNKKLLAISEGYKSPRDLIDFGKKSLGKIK